MARRLVTLAVLALLCAGCSNEQKKEQGAADAPIARTEMQGWVVLSAPDQFPNIAFRCFGKDGIYNPRLADKDAARQITVVANDPNCQ